MFPSTFYFIAAVWLLALLIDLIFGEPPWKPPFILHPTVWISRTTRALVPHFKSKNPKVEKVKGALLALTVILIFTIPVYLLLEVVGGFLGILFYVPIAAILLKTTFCIRLETDMAKAAARHIQEGNLKEARENAGYFSRRDVRKLTGQQVASAVIESISENLTDFKLSPFFYYSLFGVPGAVTFKVINTLDGTVGFKDEEHVNLGWFSAVLDTIANYVTTRLCVALITLSSLLLAENCKNAWKIAVRDRKEVSSLNHGWTVAAMAGALQVRLEKPGYYAVGDQIEDLSEDHIYRALRIRNLTVLLFTLLIVFPLLLAVSLFLPLFLII